MPISKIDTINVLDPDFIAESIEDVLEVKRAELIAELRQSLQDVNRVSTGALQSSIDVSYTKTEKGYLFSLIMDDYWKFVEKGVNGWKIKHGSDYTYKKWTKNIPNEPMQEFVRNRSLQLGNIPTHYKNSKGIFKKRKNKLSTLDASKALGAMIGHKIKEKGLKPTHFFTNVVNENWQERFIEDTLNEFERIANG